MRDGRRARRGEIRAAVLHALADQPMHGYQLIGEFSDRTDGAWSPSPGSIYPTLQLLADEGLVVSADDDGRRVFELTDAGRAALTDLDSPFEAVKEASTNGGLRRAIHDVMGAARQVARVGSTEQIERARTLIVETRRQLYLILAEGDQPVEDTVTDTES